MTADRATIATGAVALTLASALVPEHVAARSPQPLALVVGLFLVVCGLALPVDRQAGWSAALLVGAGVAWLLPAFDVTGRDGLDRAIGSLSLVHVPLLVAAIVTVPTVGVSFAARAIAIVPASAAALSAVTGGHRPALVLTGAALCMVTLVGWARSPRRRGPASLSFGGAGVVYGGTLVVAGLVRLLSDVRPERTLTTVYELAIIAAAALVLASVALDRDPEAVELKAGGAEAIEPTLARLVGDPDLAVAFPEADGWLDPLGRPRPVPGADALRLAIDGAPLAAIETSAVVDGELRVRLVELLLLGRDNARLRRAVTRQLEELAASRRRLLLAGDDERARLEAELRRGALAHLEEIARWLASVPTSSAASARERVVVTRAELEHVARGLDPLARGVSLTAALRSVIGPEVDRVTIDVDEHEIRGEVRRGLWYACAEGLANAWKHAPGANVQIVVASDGDRAVATVADDGPGGADPAGSGLRGLADRVNALGGSLEVVSSPADGTRLRVELPLESVGAPVDGARAVHDAPAGVAA